ncbi:MAG: SAM-dependent methyltransferase [Planctomycetaceae bacterium]|nr:SAM-dependent methyltransferase [Planctomycetaceae bacterium]
MQFKTDFLRSYAEQTPLPLAVERVQECDLLCHQEFAEPVLDVGCGDGIFASCLFDEKVELGIDLNARELEHAGSMNAYKELVCCAGDEVPRPDGSFRTAFSNSVLEHIPDLPPVIREVHRLLDDGGRFYVTVPTNRFDQYTVGYQILSRLRLKGLAKRFQAFFNRFWHHFHFYRPDDWERMFRENGFRVVERKEYGRKSLCLLNDAMAPLCLPSFCAKKFLNRWVLFPKLHRVLMQGPVALLNRVLKRSPESRKGGLLFLSLEKC